MKFFKKAPIFNGYTIIEKDGVKTTKSEYICPNKSCNNQVLVNDTVCKICGQKLGEFKVPNSKVEQFSQGLIKAYNNTLREKTYRSF